MHAFTFSKVRIFAFSSTAIISNYLISAMWTKMKCSLQVVIVFSTTDFLFELFCFTVWLSRLMVISCFWERLLNFILPTWSLSTGLILERGTSGYLNWCFSCLRILWTVFPWLWGPVLLTRSLWPFFADCYHAVLSWPRLNFPKLFFHQCLPSQ